MSLKYVLLAMAVSLGVGGLLGYKLVPKGDTTKEQTISTIKEVTKPDGTREIITVVKENKQTKISPAPVDKPQYRVGVGAGTGLDFKPFYSLQVEKRIIGNMFLGVQLNTKQEASVLLAIEF